MANSVITSEGNTVGIDANSTASVFDGSVSLALTYSDNTEGNFYGGAVFNFDAVDVTAYNTLTFSIDTSAFTNFANLTIQIEPPGGGASGTFVLLADYTPTATSGNWETYEIPLTAFPSTTLSGATKLGFFNARDGSDVLLAGTLYLDEINFITVSGGGGSCDPVGGELATNGGLETGDFSCWALYNVPPTISTDSASGAFAANLVISGAFEQSVLKQERIAVGTVSAGQTLNISFKMKGTAADGGVINPKIIFEDDTNGTTAIELGTIDVPTPGYTTYSYTPTTGNVGDGISMEFAVACGGASSCNANVLIDDLTITIAP